MGAWTSGLLAPPLPLYYVAVFALLYRAFLDDSRYGGPVLALLALGPYVYELLVVGRPVETVLWYTAVALGVDLAIFVVVVILQPILFSVLMLPVVVWATVQVVLRPATSFQAWLFLVALTVLMAATGYQRVRD